MQGSLRCAWFLLFATCAAAAAAKDDAAVAAYQRPESTGIELPAKGRIDLAFTPWDDAETLIVRTIGAARHQILVQAFMLSNRPITKALLAAHQRHVDVRVLADREQMLRQDNASRIPQLAQAGIPVLLETRYSSAHNKVIVVDADGVHPAVVTGSFNFTRSAQHGNAENVLVLHDHAALAQAYARNWHRHAAEAAPFVKR